jgi:hypothetical protein
MPQIVSPISAMRPSWSAPGFRRHWNFNYQTIKRALFYLHQVGIHLARWFERKAANA